MNPQFRSPADDGADIERHFPIWLGAILALAGAAYADLAARDPIFQRAEDYFAEAAREMSVLTEHVTPILYGKPFFDKPIFTYWAIQASLAAFGNSHFAARLPSIVAALATVALTASAAAGVWSRRASLMAAVVLSTSYVFFYFATMAMSDMWLTLFCTATAVLLFAGSENPGQRQRNWNLAAIFCGFAILTKGPVGVVLPAGALLLYLLLRRDLGQIRPSAVLAGLFIVAAVAGPWFLLLWRQQGMTALRAFFLVENLKRFAGTAYGTHHPFGYLPLTLLLDFLPWTIFLPAAFAQSLRTWRADWNSRQSRAELFLWCYVATVVGFFWVARTQMDYYVLPAMPACAVLTGIYMNRAMRENSPFLRLINWVSALGCCAAGILLFWAAMAAKGVWIFPWHPGLPAGLHSFWPLGIWVFAGGAAGVFLAAKRNYVALLGLTLLGFLGGATLGVHETTPYYLDAFPLPALAQAARAHAGQPAALSGDLEHWRGELSFESGEVFVLSNTPQDLTDFLGTPGPHLLMVTDEWLAKLPAKLPAQGQLIDRRPVLRQGVKLSDLLDPGVVSRSTEVISVIYFPMAVVPD